LSSVFVLDPDGSGLAEALGQRGLDARAGDRPAAGADHLVTVTPRLELEPLAELTPHAWLARFGRWVEEPFAAVQEWLRDVLARGVPGRWVAVTTNLGTQPFPGAGAVGAFAAALHTLVKVAALEYGERGLRANAVAVGFREGERPRWIDVERATADTPAGRLARQDDVAAAVAWLLTPDAEHVNGEVLRVDGGYTITSGAAAAPSDEAEEWLLAEEWRGIAR
jgi:NAD(P)-dependent dehydrogenase (short-subunit alcohol dehydrogenase family)